jgi:hypothetical protein
MPNQITSATIHWVVDRYPVTIVERAIEAARERGTSEWWFNLSSGERADEIYRQLRRIDLERRG